MEIRSLHQDAVRHTPDVHPRPASRIGIGGKVREIAGVTRRVEYPNAEEIAVAIVRISRAAIVECDMGAKFEFVQRLLGKRQFGGIDGRVVEVLVAGRKGAPAAGQLQIAHRNRPGADRIRGKRPAAGIPAIEVFIDQDGLRRTESRGDSHRQRDAESSWYVHLNTNIRPLRPGTSAARVQPLEEISRHWRRCGEQLFARGITYPKSAQRTVLSLP